MFGSSEVILAQERTTDNHRYLDMYLEAWFSLCLYMFTCVYLHTREHAFRSQRTLLGVIPISPPYFFTVTFLIGLKLIR